tara:strand:+ start:288 stop:530 length:243 start_codon:yes stop_codon:yes gene_type:complete
MNQIEELFGVPVKDINYIYLSDNEWYEINGSLEITGNFGRKPQYFSAWCLRVKADELGRQRSLRVVGNISQILLAEAEYS